MHINAVQVECISRGNWGLWCKHYDLDPKISKIVLNKYYLKYLMALPIISVSFVIIYIIKAKIHTSP